KLAAESLEQRNAKAVLIRPAVHPLSHKLLGSHIGRRAKFSPLRDGDAQHGESSRGFRIRWNPSLRIRWSLSIRWVFLFGLAQFRRPRQPEVNHPRSTLVAYQYVVRFEVAVQYPASVCGGEAAPGLDEHAQNLAPGSVTLVKPPAERVPFDVFHRNKYLFAECPDVVHRNHIWM